MPFQTIRVKLQMRGINTKFSESFYRPGAIIDQNVMTLVNALADKRKAALCKVLEIFAFSANAVEQRRVGLNRRKNDGAGALSDAKDTGNVVQNVSLLAGLFGRNYAIHGLPDDDVTFSINSGQDLSVASAATKAFLDYLTNGVNGWCMRAENRRAGDPANPVIQNIALGPAGVGFMVNIAAPPPVGQKVKISGCKGYLCRQFDGDWKVSSYQAGVMTCMTSRKIDPRFVYTPASGDVRVVDATFYSYPPYSGWDPLSVESGTRKTKKSSRR